MSHIFDTSIRPQDDFFGYVNAPWLVNNPIPPSESSWGTFYVLRDNAVVATHGILEELAHSDAASLTHDQMLLKTLYTGALDFDNNHEAHTKTLTHELRKIDTITSLDALASYLGSAHKQGYNPFWTWYVGLDDKDSSVEVLRLYQAGLNLPNRDYYLEDSERMSSMRKKYKTFYSDVQKLLPDLYTNNWASVYELEQKLATIAWTDIELRDVQKNYTKVPQAMLREALGSFNWDRYFASLGWDTPSDHFVIDQYAYIVACLELIADTPLETVRAYLKWHVVNHCLSWFSQATSSLNFEFYGTAISGIEEQKPLWKRASLLMDGLVIGELVGREYAARHFPASSKQTVLGLVEDIRTAYHARIDKLTWMTSTTKQRAHKKLDKITVFIGYPSVWKDFSTLHFTNNVLDSLLRSHIFEAQLQLAKVGKTPADEEWEMNAHTVNAYNHPNRLEIVFPAAILQPPFFDPDANYATNLGGIGAVIGHELTHGFDDQGSEFDENGTSHPWQTDQERRRFFELAENIVQQANKFETIPGTFLQGKLILGEAIADIGGLELAVEAFMVHGTGDVEDLFVNFATCECGTATEERLDQLAKIDPHPPSPFRVNCVVNHVDEFYSQYGVQPGDKLYLPPEKRAKIW